MPSISSLDHLVLTVAELEPTRSFYVDGLGMALTRFEVADGTTRFALTFGQQKINLHLAGREFEPKATHPTPGSGDLCFLSDQPLEDWMAHLSARGIDVIEGPVARSGATGALLSIYLRDPDGNLIEISNRVA